MSAIPPKADIGTQSRNVRFVPKADSCTATKLGRFDKENLREAVSGRGYSTDLAMTAAPRGVNLYRTLPKFNVRVSAS